MSATAIGLLAASYADPLDPEFLASETQVLSLNELQECLDMAHQYNFAEAAEMIAFEIARLKGEPTRLSQATLFGCKAGLWRVH